MDTQDTQQPKGVVMQRKTAIAGDPQGPIYARELIKTTAKSVIVRQDHSYGREFRVQKRKVFYMECENLHAAELKVAELNGAHGVAVKRQIVEVHEERLGDARRTLATALRRAGESLWLEGEPS